MAAASVTAADRSIVTTEFNAAVTNTSFGMQTGAPWHLDRLDSQPLVLDTHYNYFSLGAGVTIYIIDTGVRASHHEFSGRAVALANTLDLTGPADCNGHGTHVSSLAAGITYGVAKEASIRVIKALDCGGSGTVFSVAAALALVGDECAAAPDDPFVINLSLNGPPSATLDSALTNVLNACHAIATVAAGNSAANACSYSPSRVPAALTVAASTKVDQFAWFSNTGSCVDLAAPGVEVVGAWLGSDTEFTTLQGTSMAAPLVAGIAAIMFAQATPAWVPGNENAGQLVADFIKAEATVVPGMNVPLAFAFLDASNVLVMNPATTPIPPPSFPLVPTPIPSPPPHQVVQPPPAPPPPPPPVVGHAAVATQVTLPLVQWLAWVLPVVTIFFSRQ
jgi:subtilisin family serine protease